MDNWIYEWNQKLLKLDSYVEIYKIIKLLKHHHIRSINGLCFYNFDPSEVVAVVHVVYTVVLTSYDSIIQHVPHNDNS